MGMIQKVILIEDGCTRNGVIEVLISIIMITGKGERMNKRTT